MLLSVSPLATFKSTVCPLEAKTSDEKNKIAIDNIMAICKMWLEYTTTLKQKNALFYAICG
jgi:hypothetical protein